MPSRALVAFAAAAVVGVGLVGWRLGATQVHDAFHVGPGPTQVAGPLLPRARACQAPIEVLARTSAVTLWVRAHRPAPLTVTVRDLRGRVLRRARAAPAAGGATPTPASARFAPVAEGARVQLCVRNDGGAAVLASGGQQEADSATTARGWPAGTDLTLVFARARPRSPLALLPTVFRRAALFRLGFVGAWTLWLLAAAVLLGVAGLLALALFRASRDARQG